MKPVTDFTQIKIDLLKQMDKYICEVVGDEEIWEIWIALGVPDEATDEDYQYMAEDEDTWKYTCNLFGRLIQK